MEGIPAGEERRGNEVRPGYPAPHQALVKGKISPGTRGRDRG